MVSFAGCFSYKQSPRGNCLFRITSLSKIKSGGCIPRRGKYATPRPCSFGGWCFNWGQCFKAWGCRIGGENIFRKDWLWLTHNLWRTRHFDLLRAAQKTVQLHRIFHLVVGKVGDSLMGWITDLGYWGTWWDRQATGHNKTKNPYLDSLCSSQWHLLRHERLRWSWSIPWTYTVILWISNFHWGSWACWLIQYNGQCVRAKWVQIFIALKFQ